MFFTRFYGAAASIALALGSSVALAQAPLQNAFINGANILSDDSAEVTLFGIGGLGDLGIGARFVGTIGITSFPSLTGGAQASTNYNELAGIFALEVIALDPDIPTAKCSSYGIGGGGLAQCNSIQFGAVSDFNQTLRDVETFFSAPTFANANQQLAAGSLGTYANVVAGDDTVALLFEDPSQDYDRGASSLQAIFDSAINGTQVVQLGEGTTFTGISPATIADALLFGPGVNLGNFGGNLTVMSQSINGVLLDTSIGGVQVSTGGQSAPTLGSPVVGTGVFNNAEFTVNATLVPEPEMLGLMAIGLLGLGLAGRRRSAKVA